MIVGQILRSSSQWTAGRHFTHIVAAERVKGHQLVQHGLYSILRHPSYDGWFLWSVSTQLLLCNPICLPLYAYASYRFFAGRIPYEEAALQRIFGDEYKRYKKRTLVLIPGLG